jgi:TRAP-type C4-dicarboxylate transport system permease small subunit
MKKISNIFILLAIILSDVMCAVVAYNYCTMEWGIRYAGYSAPASVAFLYAIPFGIGIIVCIIIAVATKGDKSAKNI